MKILYQSIYGFSPQWWNYRWCCFLGILLGIFVALILCKKIYSNAWVVLTWLKKGTIFDLLIVTESGGWNRHRIPGGGISALLPASWSVWRIQKEKKNCRSHSQSWLIFTLNTKTGGSSQPAKGKVVFRKVIIVNRWPLALIRCQQESLILGVVKRETLFSANSSR